MVKKDMAEVIKPISVSVIKVKEYESGEFFVYF